MSQTPNIQIFADGSEVPPDVCVRTSTVRQTFTVTVESMQHIPAQWLKNAIQERYKVIDIEQTKSVSVCFPA